MARPTPEAINGPFEQPPSRERVCAFDGCRSAGIYRAPVARDRLNDYYWFCLDHVREYNKAWDYFAGMSEDEIELQRRNDTVWQRPSWPLGQFGERSVRARIFDRFGFFPEGDPGPGAAPVRPMTDEQKALAVLELREPVTFADVKTRYKTLVKKLHPDANGGDREAEERLKGVNQAYAALKTSFA